MIRTIIWYFTFVVSLILTSPFILRAKYLDKKGLIEKRDSYSNAVTANWAKIQLKVSGAKINVHGLENIPKDIPVLFISNHQSNFDINLFMSLIDKPKGYISKIEMKKIPIISTWMKYIHCVFMDRSSLKKSAAAIIEGVNILKNGYSLVIFPEGTRSKGDAMGEFKAGSFKLATKAKVPIVPVTIKGSYKLMEANNNRIRPAEVDLYIHPMIETSTLTKEEEKQLHTTVENIIKSKL
ncbi:lysophospholipid acyltransferase family protein [Clostridium cadaveris]|uniref:lysophospholipid acyltransferase family protein n=1 Tax=Clostridium cadaveris TaxID=1529 RepID=UPI0015B6EC40|nr:lysophospholipid acyltransferase family protein [Clostridium cadaveris]NWK11126.1 1-acyl-sn-glycerol-3-phosphate acyltransferase [Clostridium cadaveris]